MRSDAEKPIDRLVRAAEPSLRRLLHLFWRFTRALTMGVRAVVIDAGGKVFLVRHSYVSGWHLPRDHVAVFVVRVFRQDPAVRPNREIVESGFFSLDALPKETTPGTRRRLAEVLEGAPVASKW